MFKKVAEMSKVVAKMCDEVPEMTKVVRLMSKVLAGMYKALIMLSMIFKVATMMPTVFQDDVFGIKRDV